MRALSKKKIIRRSVFGFSLLEVMVSIAILGLALTVILSAQGGLAASGRSAANVGQSTSLARCKMTELEEKMLKFGYPVIEQIDTDLPCCDMGDNPGFTCDTRVEKVVLPQPTNPGDILGGDAGAFNLTPASSAGGLGALASASSPEGAASALSQIAGGGLPGGIGAIDLDAGLQGIGSQLTSQLGGGQGTQGLLSMVMGFVYPAVKFMMEASIRRLTVTVHWKEGSNPKEFTIVQYVTNPSNGGFQAGTVASTLGSTAAPGAGGAVTPAGAPGSPGANAVSNGIGLPRAGF